MTNWIRNECIDNGDCDEKKYEFTFYGIGGNFLTISDSEYGGFPSAGPGEDGGRVDVGSRSGGGMLGTFWPMVGSSVKDLWVLR